MSPYNGETIGRLVYNIEKAIIKKCFAEDEN